MAAKKFPLDFTHRVGLKKEDIILVNNSDTGFDEYATIEEASSVVLGTIVVQEQGDNEDKVISQKVTTEIFSTKADKTTQVIAGNGLTGGGTLSGDMTLGVTSANDGIAINADNIELITIDALDSDSTTKPLSAKQGKVLNTNKSDKVTGAVSGNFASLDANGNLLDSGSKAIDFVEVANIANNLTTEDEGKVLDARQGKVLNEGKVNNSGNETISGIKTFSSSPIVPIPTTNTQASNKGYVDAAVAQKSFYAGTMTVNFGTLNQGTVADLDEVGGTDVIIQEALGANPLQVTFDFANVTEVTAFVFFGEYLGGAMHQVYIEVYNYSTLAWDLKLIIGTEGSKKWYSAPIYNSNTYLSSGNMRVRFRHIGNGISSHQLVLDYVEINSGGSGGQTNISASSVNFVPSGGLSATDVASALVELDTEKQNALVITADTTPVDTDAILSLRGTDWLKTTWTNVKAFLKTYFDTIYVLITDLATVLPSLRYYLRVTADGGTIVDRGLLSKVYTEFNQSLANTHCLYFPQIGIKERTSGINKYANKLYDLSGNNNDAVQATEGTQPYIGGYIGPNEFRCLKYLQGQTQTGEITIPTKSYLATDSFTLFLVLKANKRGITRILTGVNSYIDINTTTIVLHNGTSATLTGTHTYDVGKIAQIEFRYSNGTGLIKVNNVPLATTVISTTMSITRLAYSSTNPFDGSIYYFHLENIRISEADSQKRYTFLRSLFPEIEGIAIGNQFWQTSNVEQTVAGNGEVIPEIQLSANGAELLTNGGFTDWTSDNPNGWTVQNENATNYITENANGANMVSDNTSAILMFQGGLTANEWYQIDINVISVSGSFRLQSGVAFGDTFATISTTGVKTYYVRAVTASLYIVRASVLNTVIRSISAKRLGWADLTSAARCYYDNSLTNGAVYNKLFNGYAVALLKNFAPSGYRVATYADWLQLSTFAGGNTISGRKIKRSGLVYWLTTNSGTNELGLSVIGLGKRNVDGTFANIGTEANFWTADGYLVTIANNADTITFAAGADQKIGAGVLLIRTSPTVPQRGVIRVSTTANIASTPVSIPIPFGCQVESIRIRNKQAATNLTSVSATHNNTAGASLGTLITGKTVNAATSSIFVATLLDMLTQETDGTIRVLATGNAAEGCDIEVTYKVMAL